MTQTSTEPSSKTVVSQHRAVLAAEVTALSADQRPVPGPIAILPKSQEEFVAAVESGGGQVEELSDRTRGVVWLASKDRDGLASVLRENPQIGWVQLPSAGIEAVAGMLAEHARAGLVVTSAKGAYAQPVAEHALVLGLALLRVLPTRLKATSWSTVPEGRSLYGLNVVIVGAGGIALELLSLLKPFGVNVTIVRRSAEPVPGAARTVRSDRLNEVLPDADLVVVAAALTTGTRHLFSAWQFGVMKDSAYIVNIARGGLIDTDALVAALDAGTIAGAGLDVTDPEPLPDDHPLWKAPNLIITPHSADTPEMTAPLLAERVRLNVEAFLGDGRFVGIVDPAAGY